MKKLGDIYEDESGKTFIKRNPGYPMQNSIIKKAGTVLSYAENLTHYANWGTEPKAILGVIKRDFEPAIAELKKLLESAAEDYFEDE